MLPDLDSRKSYLRDCMDSQFKKLLRTQKNLDREIPKASHFPYPVFIPVFTPVFTPKFPAKFLTHPPCFTGPILAAIFELTFRWLIYNCPVCQRMKYEHRAHSPNFLHAPAFPVPTALAVSLLHVGGANIARNVVNNNSASCIKPCEV